VPAPSPGFVTVTSFRVAGGRTGAEAVKWEASTKVTPVAAAPPIVTVAPARNWLPAIVKLAPAPPEVGLVRETIGGGTGVGVKVPVGAKVFVCVGVKVAVGGVLVLV